jgi:hypothetical protein
VLRALSSSGALAFLALVAGGSVAGCATALGPGYVVEKQEVRVEFLPKQQAISISAEYRLVNSGNQDLHALEVRLPGRRFDPQNPQAFWDDAAAAITPSPDTPRNTLVRFPSAWKTGEAHSVRFSYRIRSEPAREDIVGFAPDAFYLSAEGWAPQLPQTRGVFGFGGVPPKRWELIAYVPEDFLVHASGKEKRAKGRPGEHRFEQTMQDLTPFVVAGRYRETLQTLAENQKVHIWTRGTVASAQLRQSGQSLSQTLATYDRLFGARGKSRPPLWLVECPAANGCIFPTETGYSNVLYGSENARSARLISRDSVLFKSGETMGSLEAAAGPALAEGWLGYGQNPGYYEQQPPMTALPAFATAMAMEASSGRKVTDEIVRRALREIPERPAASSIVPASVTRAKSLLLFYALRQRVGADAFQKALQHMLYARQSRGFDVTDLISALDEESHQEVGPYIRQWIKRPGVPDEFRKQFTGAINASNVQQNTSHQETTR